MSFYEKEEEEFLCSERLKVTDLNLRKILGNFSGYFSTVDRTWHPAHDCYILVFFNERLGRHVPSPDLN